MLSDLLSAAAQASGSQAGEGPYSGLLDPTSIPTSRTSLDRRGSGAGSPMVRPAANATSSQVMRKSTDHNSLASIDGTSLEIWGSLGAVPAEQLTTGELEGW